MARRRGAACARPESTWSRVGVFSWARWSRGEGRYEFGWLDEVIDLLTRTGSTSTWRPPTASPPPWFSARPPRALPVDAGRVRLWPGAARPTAPPRRSTGPPPCGWPGPGRAVRDHPALRHVARRQRVRLPRRTLLLRRLRRGVPRLAPRPLRDLTRLNAAWGTRSGRSVHRVGGGRLPPRSDPDVPNPARCWTSAGSAPTSCSTATGPSGRCAGGEPRHAVTTNFMAGLHWDVDYWRWAAERGPGLHRPLPRRRRPRAAHRPGLRRRHHPRPRRRRPVAADGALHRRGQLAAAQPRQDARRRCAATPWPTWPAAPTARCSSSGGPPAHGAEKYHSAMVPHARHGLAVWREVLRARRRRCAGWRRSRAPGRRRRGDRVRLAERLGRRNSPATRAST